ncbi:MAG: universal stress protein [Candidatus Marinimicrobia bacterium]|nr:universal stress protein [Candidatus Neomarinimicrobiota bacterium]MBT4155787.1 universal stress protein [Candidatus Neomarinimicrobiota bacterium]MBT4554093.1 universal stress protein [Candidatus Neomarinimicrobiota bacterium]MBT6867101.1 universal stress protein [Candidatus Neomarinimicrobiota bacterium]MBT7042126.1 universal stress protein [Candidatus Neomarinimicrobiota bacterium]
MNNIYVGIVMDGDEKRVIEHAIAVSEKFNAKLTAIHVNDEYAGEMSMMMDSPEKYEENDIRDAFRTYGFEVIAETMNVKIIKAENIPKAIVEESSEADLLVLGHKRMSSFKASFMDSTDEGVVNLIECPVLVVQK